jgi:hypothetical protein
MIKRQYFMAGEIYLKNGTKTMFFRQFCHSSIFANPKQVLELWQEQVALDNKVEITDLAITAFNKC